MRMSIVLIGYRGSGKTTIGRKLASRLWQDLVDTDQLIVSKAGKNITNIFIEDGEQAFRDMETEIVLEALKLQEVVISLGGGAVMREENRFAIKNSGHKVIYLRCHPQVLYHRLSSDSGNSLMRPSLTSYGGTIDEIQSMLAIREPLYRGVMTAELDVTNLTVDDALVYIVRLL
jgi:shikimate kinase